MDTSIQHNAQHTSYKEQLACTNVAPHVQETLLMFLHHLDLGIPPRLRVDGLGQLTFHDLRHQSITNDQLLEKENAILLAALRQIIAVDHQPVTEGIHMREIATKAITKVMDTYTKESSL